MSYDLKKHYICKVPFEYLEVHHMGVYSCCPAWLPTKLTDVDDVKNVWKSETLKKVQESILDGSYSHCVEELCPVLSELINQGTVDRGFFITKDEFAKNDYTDPKIINYSFDRSCNLSCPSCRKEPIMANNDEISEIDVTIKDIENSYGEKLKGLYISGTADPFASKSFRKLLTQFDRKKYPNVQDIHLHTNALLLNKTMWDKMDKVQSIIRIVEISIDASTKETYETIRRGGNWETLIENLKFIATLPIKEKRISMVVQDSNFMEMELFYDTMMSIFNNKARIFFKRIDNWGTYSNEEFKEKEVFKEDHPMFNMFLLQLKKIDKKYNCVHNMHDIVLKHLKQETKLI
jgi:wyosine [tRNA(Phe)-imidazoG37] synthetase (radical SAM superfamily)